MKIQEKPTLVDLWHGNIDPFLESQCDPRQTELIEFLERHSKEVSEKLDKEGLESFEKFKDCYLELLSISCENAFVKGFSLASKILSESFS